MFIITYSNETLFVQELHPFQHYTGTFEALAQMIVQGVGNTRVRQVAEVEVQAHIVVPMKFHQMEFLLQESKESTREFRLHSWLHTLVTVELYGIPRSSGLQFTFYETVLPI